MEREVIKTWKNGRELYIEDNEYRLDGEWGTATLLLARTPLGIIVTTSNKDVPKPLLYEIGENLSRLQ